MDLHNNIVDITEIPPQQDLNHYYWFESYFSDSDCDKILTLGKSKELESSTVFSGNSSVRKSKVGWIPRDSESAWIFNSIGECVSKANEGWAIDWEGFREDLQFSQYDSVGSHYDYHMDIGLDHYHRKISVVVQLSDPSKYKGGQLMIDSGSNEVRCPQERGSVILFPSFLLHKVSPLKSGERNSLVAWASGPNWK